ncbi:hypothetical protein [Pantoea septica]|uniref:hypothetical protein n=1 Tax=Pantoea septica TaxID=472695 RepID=UPI0028D3E528|nr:hypothetical protein [Pantoea septica]
MNKLTAEVARQDLNHLKSWVETCGISMKEERYMQALEIALPVLEQQEKKQDVSLREGLAALSDHIDSIGGYNFEALEAYRREEFGRQEKGNDDWVEWKGGECPVADGLAVTEVKFRSGDVVKAFADTWWWGHSGDEDDIIAYRVVEQERERGEEE